MADTSTSLAGGDTRRLVLLAVGALGIVYGDIGTSPLYALRESFLAHGGIPVDEANVLGVVSLIFWSLTIVITVKYVSVVMRADNHGEGGILALTALIGPAERRRSVHWGIVLLGIFGTALLYGDGMITPAISVLSAVEGFEIATPALERFVLPVAVAILVGLFLVQRHGTHRVGAVFGPVMMVWFASLALLGATHIADAPRILTAVSPAHAVDFFVRTPAAAFLALGSVFLVVTGGEALYADMGHFGKRPIRLGWVTMVFPALILNYLGQGALLLSEPAAIDNPFYRLAPSWALLPLVGLATMATVIASQALISGAFSLTLQAVRLGYLPRVRITHTFEHAAGQVYVPAVNWGLMVACTGLVLGFGSSTGLAGAYGVAVTATMVVTTILLAVVARRRWGWSLPVTVAVTAPLLVVDLAFFGANLFKVPAGGWFPLVVGILIFTVMTTWKRGRRLLAEGMRRGLLPLTSFVEQLMEEPPARVPGTAVYLFPEEGATPPALLTSLRFSEVLHETVAVCTVLTSERPRVLPARRAKVTRLGPGFVQVVLDFGFMERPDVPRALGGLVSRHFSLTPEDTFYVTGRETVLATKKAGMALWRERLFALMARNATSAADFFQLPARSVIEIGTRVEI